MDFFRRLAQQLREVWASMSALRRTLVIGVALLLVALIAGLYYYRSQPEWAVLYSHLSQDETQAIRDKLQTQGVPVRVSYDGSTVEVPADRVGTVRIDLAAQGLPAQAKGYELFDEPSLASTPFQQNVNLMRAKQAVIAKTIRQLDPVANATVEIAKSEPSPFIREKQPTTASVMVTLKPNASLSRSQVAGIVAFVSKAVEGLTPENVTVVDSKGNQLSEPNTPEMGQVSSQMDYRRALESYLAEKAQSILVPALGAGRAVVKVTADINFQRVKTVSDTINPDQKALQSERTTSSKTQSSGGPGGIPGTRSNLAQAGRVPALAGGGGSSTSTSEDSESTYAYSRTHQELEDKLGSLNRLTVAATVDLTPPEGGQPALTREKVEALIKQSLGFDETRGDTIQVAEAKLATTSPSQPSPTEQPSEPPVAWWQNPQLLRYSPWVIAVLAFLVFGWVLIRALNPPGAEREQVGARLAEAAHRDPQALARAITALMEQP